MRQGGTNGIRIQRRRSTATKCSPCWPYHADARECPKWGPATVPGTARGLISTACRWPTTGRPPGHGHSPAPGRCFTAASQRPQPICRSYQPFLFAPPKQTRHQNPPPCITRWGFVTSHPPCTHRALLHRRVPDLFIVRLVYLPRLGRPRSNRRGQAAQGPGCARLLVCVFDPAFAVASRHHAPYLSD